MATFQRTGGLAQPWVWRTRCATGPGRIVLFGGIARNGELLMAPLRERFHEALLNIYHGRWTSRCSALPDDDAALLGAAALGHSLST
jgi:glucokinase